MKKLIPYFIFPILLFALCAHAQEVPRVRRAFSEDKANEAELRARIADDPRDVEALKGLCNIASMAEDLHDALDYARRINAIADSTGNDYDKMFACFHIGHSLLFLNKYDSVRYYMDTTLELALDHDDTWGITSAYNGLGMYTVSVEMDYYKGLSYFMEGIEAAERAGDDYRYSSLAHNLAITYFLRKDPQGLKYALDVYNYGQEHENKILIFSGAYVTAAMYYLARDYDNALKYIAEASQLVDDMHDHTGIYALYGDILLARGEVGQARRYYEQSMEHISLAQATSAMNAYLGYGRLLIGQGNYYEAIEVLRKGIDISDETNNTVFRYELHHNLSLAYEKLSDYRTALALYKDFHDESETIFSREREYAINDLMIRYEAEKREKQLQEKELNLVRSQNNLHLTVFVLIVIALSLGAVYLLYYRKNKLYKQIVKQNMDSVRRERQLEEKLVQTGMVREADDCERYNTSSLTDEKGKELFHRLEDLMRTDKPYLNAELTKDKLSELINSNRTYLSQVVNKYTGLSVLSYINSYRINDAIRILSDREDDTPLKAIAMDVGFNSQSTFFKLFHDRVGMTPNKYRSMAKVIPAERDDTA